MKTVRIFVVLPSLISAISCATIRQRQVAGLTLIPLAADTIKGCDVQVPANEIDSCDTIAKMFSLTSAQFITYNPSVGLDCSNLKIAQAYCIHVQQEPTTLLKPQAPKPKAAPGETYKTTIGCALWQKIFPDDVTDKKGTCTDLAKIWGIGDNLMKWNPGLTPDCSNLKVDTYLCVRIPTTTG